MRLPRIFAPALVLAATGCGDQAPSDDDGRAAFEPTIFSHAVDAQTGIATGEFAVASIAYEPIEVPEKFRHVLNFQMTPMLPPFRQPLATSGPLILYSDEMDVMVFSPMDHFYESVIELRDGKIEYGIEGEIDEIPEGFTHRFVLVEGKGMSRTVDAWGAALRSDRGAEPTDRYADLGVSHLGYWTDNGAYYYYRTEDGLNEADTLLAVKADADDRSIPISYLQLDSWWYFKAGSGTNLAAGGLVRWEPQPEMFPDGLAAFQQQIDLPLIVHNRWFAKENAYIDDYDFVEGEEMALPLGRGVFDKLMKDAKSWGVFTYEQDWLMLQFWGVPHLRNGIGHSAGWIRDIHDAAKDQDLTVQLTMPGGAHLMDTVDRPAVTTLRTSIDYAPGIAKQAFWPQFHTVNMLARAVGVLPFKDNFHSSEKWGEAEALISILSAGMVGPGDQVGKMDADLLLRTCRRDGLLLKPDAPAVPIDAMFLEHSRPYTTMTHSDRDEGRWTYVGAYLIAQELLSIADNIFATASYDGQQPSDHYPLPVKVNDWRVDLEADLQIGRRAVVYDWRRREAFVADGSFEIAEMSEVYDHGYFVLAPIASNGLALIGETDKFVTMADRRFRSITVTGNAFEVTVVGVPDEIVELTAFDVDNDRLLDPVSVTIDDSGQATTTLGR